MRDIEKAIEILRAGGLVAFPTETVYGLGADAGNSAAVQRIFAAKGRPVTNPLIVHVADAVIARRYVTNWPSEAEKLAAAFWPGPITFVLPKNSQIADEATAGRPTVGLRVPDHPLALSLLRKFDGPLAAPSANRSTRISPTTAEHVRDELSDRVDLILDGGPCRVGIESTVLDLSQNRPIILRPGSIRREQIESIIGPVELFVGSNDPSFPAASPGQQAVHYSPQTPAFRFEAGDIKQVLEHAGAGRVIVLMFAASLTVGNFPRAGVEIIEMPESAEFYARRLYAALHEADDRLAEAIWIELPPNTPSWQAVRDRIHRATRAFPSPQ